MDNTSFFSSGQYGCAIYPRITCKGNQSKKINKKNNLISKITVADFYSDNEYYIGNKLSKIKNNESFIFIEKQCGITKKTVKKINDKYTCKATKDTEKGKNFVMLYSKYVPSIQLTKFFETNFSIKDVYKYYVFCLKNIDILLENNIIHRDMHLGNILINTNKEMFLIDFGLSLYTKKLYKNNNKINYEYLSKILITYDNKWYYWTIENHILNHYIFKKTKLDNITLKMIIEDYYNNNHVFKTLYIDNDLYNYKKEVYNYYSNKFVNNQSIDTHIKDILNNAIPTWDLYQLSYLTFYLLKDEYNNIQSLNELFNILKKSLHFNYNVRPSIKGLLNLNLGFIKNGEPLLEKTSKDILNKEDIKHVSRTIDRFY